MNTASTQRVRRLAATAVGVSCSVALIGGAAAGLTGVTAHQVWGNATTHAVNTSAKVTAKQVWGNRTTGAVRTAGNVTAKQVWGNSIRVAPNNTWGN